MDKKGSGVGAVALAICATLGAGVKALLHSSGSVIRGAGRVVEHSGSSVFRGASRLAGEEGASATRAATRIGATEFEGSAGAAARQSGHAFNGFRSESGVGERFAARGESAAEESYTSRVHPEPEAHDPLRGLGMEQPRAGHVAAFGESSLTPAASDTAESAVKSEKMSVIAVSPDSKESFHTVYGAGRPYSANAARDLQRFETRVNGLVSDASYLRTQQDGAADLMLLVSAAPQNRPVVIIGHSVEVDGQRMLVLPNGEQVSLESIHNHASRAHRECIVITCYSPDLAMTKRISLQDAYALCNAASKRSATTDRDELVTIMKNEFHSIGTKRKLSIVGIGSGVVGSGAAMKYYLADGKDG